MVKEVMSETTGEKIIRIETQMTNVTSEINEVKSLVKEVITKVDAMATFQVELRQLDGQITTLNSEITTLKNFNGLKNTLLWVGLVASAIINIVVIYQLFVGK